ncbi:glycine receptor subunit alpha-3-like [Centruroides sculpturatus]|uniref:glycine receptor subunit alpha-3-like n=1 Tax=Centruroides sculpturatus TaxID=218467 RepID=UPI000C6CDAE2|nr:glycine receptor subunit alpha-3-like [Centruroides sculpturatus]
MHWQIAFFLLFTGLFLIKGDPTTNGNHRNKLNKLGTAHKGHHKSQDRLAFLDEMLIGYDKRAWPTYGTGKPTLVTVNMYVNSIGSVNAASMEFSMDIYLRQSWLDHRLQLYLYGTNTTITMNGEDLIEKIWKPDLFFRNVKEADFHYVTVPNKLLRIHPNGDILFSMRLTLKLHCHMIFKHYPLDTQKCNVVLGPYAQTIDQISIKWQDKDPIVLEQPVELSEFDIDRFYHGSFLRSIDTGSFSFLNATFIFVRQNGYHLVQTYLPTSLIVMISWVSFWLNVDATPARVTLGVTTLLALTTVASGVRTQLPPVSYVKAIDIWIGVCSVMVFGALLEFTLVNYLSRSKKKLNATQSVLHVLTRKKEESTETGTKYVNDEDTKTELQINAQKLELAMNLKRARTVDRVCRVLFPLAFLTFNLAYWPYYSLAPPHY